MITPLDLSLLLLFVKEKESLFDVDIVIPQCKEEKIEYSKII